VQLQQFGGMDVDGAGISACGDKNTSEMGIAKVVVGFSQFY